MLVSRLYTLIGLAVVAVGVSAQTLDTCIVNCLTLAESPSTCTSYVNTSCVCVNQAYQKASSACLLANCTTAEQQAALQLQQSNCGSTSNASSSAAASGTAAATGSAASVTSSSSAKSKATSPVEQLTFLTTVITIAGVALGGALAL